MRFLLMIAVAGGVVFGILKFKDRLDRIYGRYFDREIRLEKTVEGDGVGMPSSGRSTAQFLRSSRPEIADQSMKSLAIDPACQHYVADLERLDLIALDHDHYQVTYQQLPVKPENCAFNDPAVSAVLQALRSKCKPTVNQSEPISEECAGALFMSRAAMTKQMFATKPLSSIVDMRVLTDLMFAEFARVNDQTLPDLKRAQAIADRMLELNPNLYVAAKVIAFAEVIEGLNGKNGQAGDWSAAAAAVARAKELNPSDDSLQDAQMLVETRGFEPTLAVIYADRKISENASNAKAYYIKAYAQWKQGDRKSALANLKQASVLAPETRFYAQNYVEASRPDARPDAFKGSITFGVDSKDFDK